MLIRHRRMDWRARIADLPPEQRALLIGGSLSQRFTQGPLGLTHPALIGAFYGLIISVALATPLGYQKDWALDVWMQDWSYLALMLMLLMAVLGHISLIIAKVSKRPPVALWRSLVFPMPFVGLILFTAALVADLNAVLPSALTGLPIQIAWLLLLIPGPVYVQLSWAPRWRILCRLEDGLEPFEGRTAMQPIEAEAPGDDELERAHDALESPAFAEEE